VLPDLGKIQMISHSLRLTSMPTSHDCVHITSTCLSHDVSAMYTLLIAATQMDAFLWAEAARGLCLFFVSISHRGCCISRVLSIFINLGYLGYWYDFCGWSVGQKYSGYDCISAVYTLYLPFEISQWSFMKMTHD